LNSSAAFNSEAKKGIFKRLEEAGRGSSGRCATVQCKCWSRQLPPSGAQTEQIMLTGYPAFGVTNCVEWLDNASTAKGWPDY